MDQGNQGIYPGRYTRVKDTIVPTYKEKSTGDYSISSRNDDNNVYNNAYNSSMFPSFTKHSRLPSDRSNLGKIMYSSSTRPKSPKTVSIDINSNSLTNNTNQKFDTTNEKTKCITL